MRKLKTRNRKKCISCGKYFIKKKRSKKFNMITSTKVYSTSGKIYNCQHCNEGYVDDEDIEKIMNAIMDQIEEDNHARRRKL
jgi:uncharacterized protein with PIN domain